MVWIIDLDGVVWLDDRPIRGSADALARLRTTGDPVLFVTNHSGPRLGELVGKLVAHGIPADADEIVTSPQAAASLTRPGSRVLVLAAEGVEEACQSHGTTTVRDGPAEAVVVGLHRDFDLEGLTAAVRAVLGGARLIATNDDATFPTPEGLLPGAGAIVAAVSAATGVEATIAGKPHEPMAGLVRERLGGELHQGVVVGDRPATDGLFARRLGFSFALVLSGVTSEVGEPGDVGADVVAADLASLIGPSGELSGADERS